MHVRPRVSALGEQGSVSQSGSYYRAPELSYYRAPELPTPFIARDPEPWMARPSRC